MVVGELHVGAQGKKINAEDGFRSTFCSTVKCTAGKARFPLSIIVGTYGTRIPFLLSFFFLCVCVRVVRFCFTDG